jgi:hypothetical protein
MNPVASAAGFFCCLELCRIQSPPPEEAGLK